MGGIARMAAIGSSHVGVATGCVSSSRVRRVCPADRDLYCSIFSSCSPLPAQAKPSARSASAAIAPLSLNYALLGSGRACVSASLGRSSFLGRSFKDFEWKRKVGTKGGSSGILPRKGERKCAGAGITPTASAASAADAAESGQSGTDETLGKSLGQVNESKAPQKKLANTLMLGSLFGLWYLFNIYFNIYNKQVLKTFPYPINLTALQLLMGSIFSVLMWTTGLHKRPQVTGDQLLRILPLAVTHLLGNMLTNVSLGKVSVSFTHTIKALEPFFTVVLSALFLGEFPKPLVLASLVPIVGGVGLASISEVSFNWPGFWSAMGSNLTFQSRNVLSKKVMTAKEKALDNINLFSIITILSCLVVLPIAFFTEGVKLTPTVISAAGLNVNEIMKRSLLAAICFHAYQQVSYMILEKVNPVTHSVGNCVKRVVVIVSSVIFFQTPVSPVNALGTAIALAGVFLYSRVKGAAKPKKA